MIGDTASIITAKSNSVINFPSKIKCFNWREDSNVNNMISYSASSRIRLNLSLGACTCATRCKFLGALPEILGAQLKILGVQLTILGASISKEKVKSLTVPRLRHLQFVAFISDL